MNKNQKTIGPVLISGIIIILLLIIPSFQASSESRNTDLYTDIRSPMPRHTPDAPTRSEEEESTTRFASPDESMGDWTWLHTNVSGWRVTANLSSVSVNERNITLDYDKARSWPIGRYSAGGPDVVANPWIVFNYQGTTYAATWEWLRPGQITKSTGAVDGSHIKSGRIPSSWCPHLGQRVGFFVSGLARGNARNVQERSNVVWIEWPLGDFCQYTPQSDEEYFAEMGITLRTFEEQVEDTKEGMEQLENFRELLSLLQEPSATSTDPDSISETDVETPLEDYERINTQEDLRTAQELESLYELLILLEGQAGTERRYTMTDLEKVHEIMKIVRALNEAGARPNTSANTGLTAPGASGVAPHAPFTGFNRDLTLGSTGEDVRNLQKYLNDSGHIVSVSGAGSPGNETNYFGSLTQSALARFQAANGISPALGYFGPITRNFITTVVILN